MACSTSSSADTSSFSSSSSSFSSSSSTSQSSHGSRHRIKKRHRKGHNKSESRKTSKRRIKERHSKDDHSSLKRSKTKRKRMSHRSKRMDKESDTKKKKSNGFIDDDRDSHSRQTTNNPLEMASAFQAQEKAMIHHNANIAKAMLESKELQKVTEEQAKMYQLYGVIDWRAKKKLRAEKKKLERTVAAGQKLASLEEREQARMDAFRVALGLPTAEAQRQAQWRVEATQALLEIENSAKTSLQKHNGSRKFGLIGPSLPP